MDAETKQAFLAIRDDFKRVRADIAGVSEAMATKEDVARMQDSIRADIRDVRAAVARLERHTGLEAR